MLKATAIRSDASAFCSTATRERAEQEKNITRKGKE